MDKNISKLVISYLFSGEPLLISGEERPPRIIHSDSEDSEEIMRLDTNRDHRLGYNLTI